MNLYTTASSMNSNDRESMSDKQAWTSQLGYQLQRMAEHGADDYELAAMEHNLLQAIQQVKFIRRCYNKPTSTTEVSS